MSLLGTLAKVAVGIAVAKGVGSMMKKSRGASGGTPAPKPDGGLFGEATRADTGGQPDNLEDLMGSVLGGKGRKSSGGKADAGLGGLLDQLAGGAQKGGQAGGGLGDLLGGLTGGKAGGGGLGDLLGGLVGGAAPQSSGGSGGSFGDLLNQSIQNRGEPEEPPTQDQEAMAALMLRAMIQAAKSDGKVDQAERDKLIGTLGDVSEDEKAFVRSELQRPIDIEGLASQVPAELREQVYLMSVMGIDLDNRAEAQYLHDFATAMNLGRDQVNAVHDELGVQRIYA